MDTFTPPAVREIAADIKEALAAVEAKHGITFTTGGVSYNDSTFRVKVEAALGRGVDVGKKDWDTYCRRFGFEPEHYGKKFTSNGREFTVSGIKPRSSKYPILATSSNGKTYKFHTSALLVGMVD